MSKKDAASEAGELDFIQDNELRKTIENAIQYIYIILDKEDNDQ